SGCGGARGRWMPGGRPDPALRGRPTSSAQLTATTPSTVGNRHPVVGSQRFCVHGSPSSQTSGGAVTHAPPWQASSPLHTLPSPPEVPSGGGGPGTPPRPATNVSTPVPRIASSPPQPPAPSAPQR